MLEFLLAVLFGAVVMTTTRAFVAQELPDKTLKIRSTLANVRSRPGLVWTL